MDTFHTTASATLNHLADFFDTSWGDADVDLGEDALLITLPTHKQYIINKHGVTQQLWVSSPFTGAHHFAYQEGAWMCTRTGIRLEDLLKNERETYAP